MSTLLTLSNGDVIHLKSRSFDASVETDIFIRNILTVIHQEFCPNNSFKVTGTPFYYSLQPRDSLLLGTRSISGLVGNRVFLLYRIMQDQYQLYVIENSNFEMPTTQTHKLIYSFRDVLDGVKDEAYILILEQSALLK